MKNLLSILLSAVIILSGLTFAFADDPEEALPPSSGASADIELPTSNLPVTLTDEETIQSDLELRQFSVNLARSIGAPNGTETAADIYNLLYDVITHDPSGFSYFRVYDTDTHVFLQRIINILTDYSGSSSNTESPFYTSGDASSRLSIAQLLLVLTTNVLDLVEMDSSGSSSSLVQYLVNCYNTYISIDGKLSSILNCLTDDYGMTVANRLYDIKSVLFDMRGNELYYTKTWIGDIKNFLNNDIVPKVNHIDSDLHDIKQWLEDTFYYDDVVQINNYLDYYASGGTYPHKYIYEYPHIQPPANNYLGIFMNFVVPSEYFSNSFDVIIHSSNGYINTLNYDSLKYNLMGFSIDNNNYGTDIVQYYNNTNTMSFSYEQVNNDIIIHVVLGDNPLTSYNSDYYGFTFLRNDNTAMINDTNITAYMNVTSSQKKNYIKDISDTLIHSDNDLHYMIGILDTFKELYASDDLIAAKQDQQAFEDQALGDFVGSGSASITLSDLGTAKDVALDSASSLNTGVGASSALSVLSPSTADLNDGGLFHWFTQDNADHINNYVVYQYQPTRSAGDNILPDVFSGSVYDRINNPQSRND